jgi:hypothetical protein
LGILTRGRSILERTGELQLRERTGTYNALFDGKKEDIGPENGYYWDVILIFQLVSVARPQELARS